MNHNEWELPPSQGSGGLDDWAIPAQPQPGAQFGAKPSQPASGGSGGGSGSGKRKLLIALAAAVVLALIGGITVFFTTSAKTIAAMSYVSADDPGPNPFMQSTTDKQVSTLVSDGDLAAAETSGAVDGSDPNLYGGSGQLSVCDANALVSNLKQDSMLNAAFAAGIGINAEDVEQFVLSLKSVVLRQDTWVTNHGYADGKPTPYQAVLQRGTAVMVDSWGVPRVRCSCGNPLAEAWNGYTAPSNASSSWDGYDSAKVATVYGGNEQSSELSVADISTGAKEKVRIDDAELKAQKNAVNSVTADTPRTMPKDMGVKPDEKLLDELGIPVAKYDDKQRPTGGERFNEKVDGADESAPAWATGPNFPDWKSQTTMVDAGKFDIGSDRGKTQYMITMPDKDVWCEVMTKDGTDNLDFVTCRSVSSGGKTIDFKDMKVSAEAERGTRLLNSIGMHTGESAFGLSNIFYPGYRPGGDMLVWSPDVTLGELAIGESVQIGDVVCFNLANQFGCAVPESKFFYDVNRGAFMEDSLVAYGTICGQTADGAGTTVDVLIGPGTVDCETAMSLGEQFVPTLNTVKHQAAGIRRTIDGWVCGPGSRYDYGHVGRVGTCARESGPPGLIVFQ